MRIYYQPVIRILAVSVSLFIGLLFLSASLPSQVATPRNNRVVRRVCKDLSVQFRKRTSWVLVDLPHFAKRGRSVYCAQFVQQPIIHSDMKRYMYHLCIKCFNASNSFSKVLFLPGKHRNWKLPAQAHFWFGLKCPLHSRFKHRLWKASHVIRSDNSELQVPIAKNKLEKSPFGPWELYVRLWESLN